MIQKKTLKDFEGKSFRSHIGTVTRTSKGGETYTSYCIKRKINLDLSTLYEIIMDKISDKN